MLEYCELKPMALESNESWIARDQHKSGDQQQLFVSDTVPHSHQRAVKVSSKHHAQTERFTQTEYRGNCVEAVATSHKEPVMFEQAIQQHQPQSAPVQMYSTIDKKDIAPDKGTNISEFPFCYNVNMLQKVHQTQTGSQTATAVASITTDDKACYRFDVAQPFSYNYALVNQMSLAAAASTATFKCDICGLVFAHLSLLNHHKRIHNSNSDISSERTFSSEQPSEIKLQVKTTTTKSRCCNTCGGEMLDCEHNINVNKKMSKFVKCESCHENPSSSTTTATTNGSFTSPSSSPEPDSPPAEIINLPNKGLHLVKRHGLATVTKCHKCNGSGIIFIGGAVSGSTKPANDKPFRCNVCDGSFSRYSSLWSHKRLHSGDKPFKCDMCGLTFARAAYLKNHVRVHSGEKPYKCNVCGMQFSQSPHLKNHERIHSGERPYQCEVCEKTFARHSTLWNHRRIHTGEKPYRCSVCGSSFNQATHLKNHAKVHTGEKPHRCDICEVGFSDRFALKRHKLIHEKYGRTNSNREGQVSQQPSQQSTSQIGELYKCEVAFPGQQPNSSSNQQLSQQENQTKMFKCDASTSASFTGSHSIQSNSVRTSQQQQSDMYKSDVSTSASFPQQANQTSLNVQSTQKQNSSTLLNQQSSNQMNKMYGSSVGFSGQAQQQSQQSNSSSSSHQIPPFEGSTSSVSFSDQKQQNQPTTTQQTQNSGTSRQTGQYEVGNGTMPFAGQQQNQQQHSIPSTSQQITRIPSEIFPTETVPETIVGT